MNAAYKKLSYSLKWLYVESLTYHAIFMIHQIYLCKIAGYALYGSIGALFSMIYLAVTVTSFGLESSLSPFFATISSGKTTFIRFFIPQLIVTLILSCSTFPIFILLQNLSRSLFKLELTISFIALLSLLIASESIKKTFRGILYLAFKNKINTYIEILSIILYITAVWVLYAHTKHITIELIFIPMLIISLTTNLALLYYIYRFYTSLPTNKQTSLTSSYIKTMSIKALQCRAINFTNQFSHNLFSGNFLVPFFAIQFGLAQAGIFKLLTYITYTITMLMRKIFGWASDALLSQTKTLPIINTKNIFNSITQKIYNIILALGIFFAINMNKIVAYTGTPTHIINWQLIYFFIIITLIENLFISYEKLYIAQEKNSILLLLNLVSMGTLSIIIGLSGGVPQYVLLLLIIVTRATIFCLLAIISFYKWGIAPKAKIKPLYIALSLVASIVFFSL